MILIHFLKRSTGVFWITALVIAMGWSVGINPSNCHAANGEGIYSGAFSGERNGTWFMVVDGAGNGQIYFWITSDEAVDSGKVAFSGKEKSAFTCIYGISGSVAISQDGRANGNWTLNGIGGTLNGELQDPSTLKKLAGTYAGRCSGNETADLRLTVAANGSVNGSVTWHKNNLAEEGHGVVNGKGDFIFLTRDDTSIYGTLTSSGEINGVWNNPFWETRGTIGDVSKTKIKNSSKSVSAENPKMPVYVESESGENGCFIQTTRRF